MFKYLMSSLGELRAGVWESGRFHSVWHDLGQSPVRTAVWHDIWQGPFRTPYKAPSLTQ